jgi:hypothetical protein
MATSHICQSVKFHVTYNLCIALTHLRDKTGLCVLWIDAVSIKLQDTEYHSSITSQRLFLSFWECLNYRLTIFFFPTNWMSHTRD